MLGIVILALMAAYFTTAPADALPTFAKAYGIQCSVCHTVPPQLNAYGRYIQRTGYAALSRDLLKRTSPVTFAEQATTDTSYGNGRPEFGNTALHAAGYLSPNLTYHIHQWLWQNGKPGGLDTMQIAYSGGLLRGNGHLFVGKLSALPVPGPFSNGSDLAPYASAELQVGEHMYQNDMMRWGAALSYVRPKFFAEAAWFGSNADWSGAGDFSANTDKTVQWIAAYADGGQPLEAGLYGSIGSFPLAEGGVDHYHTIAAYVQRDPGPKYVPGIFVTNQWGYDGNPGSMTPMGATMGVSPAQSRALTLEIYEPFFSGRVMLGLRNEMTDDGLGTITHTGNVDLALTPFARYEYVHVYLESAMAQNAGPRWRSMVWLALPIGGPPTSP
ncbi:MAG: hypothetical protein ACYDGM_09565 [Vulcanimicrobiaceae bacterium]